MFSPFSFYSTINRIFKLYPNNFPSFLSKTIPDKLVKMSLLDHRALDHFKGV